MNNRNMQISLTITRCYKFKEIICGLSKLKKPIKNNKNGDGYYEKFKSWKYR